MSRCHACLVNALIGFGDNRAKCLGYPRRRFWSAPAQLPIRRCATKSRESMLIHRRPSRLAGWA